MKRCMSPVNGRASSTLRRKAFSPQLWSCSQSPVIRPTSMLNTFDGSVLWIGSRRGDFQPLTRSVSASSIASMAGISAGSSWPSPSSITIRGAVLAAKPAARAADFPWPMSSRNWPSRRRRHVLGREPLHLARRPYTPVSTGALEHMSIPSPSRTDRNARQQWFVRAHCAPIPLAE